MIDSLVSTAWLLDNIDNPKVKIIDASWHMPDSGRSAVSEYEEQHIKNAVFFDIDRIVDTNNPSPHMLPEESFFSESLSALGIGNEHHIIVYDSSPFHSGLRVWWMLRAFGHEDVSYMDGGLTKWITDGYPLVSDKSAPAPAKFIAALRSELVKNSTDIFENITTKKAQVIDARASARFTAEMEEPRAGLRSGHIPNSINIPFISLFDDNDGTMLGTDEIRDIFTNAGTDFNRPIVTSCGSGVTACALMMALKSIGKDDVAVYDGSWSEWGSLSEDIAPVSIGSD